MIQNLLNDYFDGNLSLEEALIAMEQKKHELEMELTYLKDFKQEKSLEIETLTKEYPEGFNGYRFEVRQGRKTYDFKGIPEWENCDKAKKECETKLKAMLNAKIKGAVHANISEDGEELMLPEINYGKPSVIIKEITTV